MSIRSRIKNLLNRELSTKQKQSIPGWLIALVAITVIAGFVIFWAPRLFQARPSPEAEVEKLEGVLHYGPDAAVVKVSQTAVYPIPDNKEERICSAIFNELVTVLDKTAARYWKVQLSDGIVGYVRSSDLAEESESVEPNLAYYKALVLGREKGLFTHAKRGELKQLVPLGSVLYADYQTQELLRVKLVGNERAWVSSEDLLVLAPDEKVEIPKEEQVTRFISSMMAFHGAPRLPGQMTIEGADMAGAVCIAARLNGLDLPRTVEAQAKVGERIDLKREAKTGLVDLSQLKPGDLVYFAHPETADVPFDLACVMDDSLVLMNQVNSSTIGIWDLANDEERHKQIAFVIRHFPREDE